MGEIKTTAYTLVPKDEDRFLPVPMKGSRNKKFAVMHPIFALRSQAVEYRDNGMKQKVWVAKPRVVKVEIKRI